VFSHSDLPVGGRVRQRKIYPHRGRFLRLLLCFQLLQAGEYRFSGALQLLRPLGCLPFVKAGLRIPHPPGCFSDTFAGLAPAAGRLLQSRFFRLILPVLKFLPPGGLLSLFLEGSEAARIKMELPVLYLDDAGAQAVQNSPVMADEQQGRALFQHPAAELHPVSIQIGGGFIGKDQNSVLAHGRQTQAGHLAAAQAFAAQLSRKPKLTAFLRVRPFRPLPELPEIAHRRLAGHAPLLRGQFPGQDVQKRGLARPVGPDDADAVPFVHGQLFKLQYLPFTKRMNYMVCRQQNFRHKSTSLPLQKVPDGRVWAQKGPEIHVAA